MLVGRGKALASFGSSESDREVGPNELADGLRAIRGQAGRNIDRHHSWRAEETILSLEWRRALSLWPGQ